MIKFVLFIAALYVLISLIATVKYFTMNEMGVYESLMKGLKWPESARSRYNAFRADE